MKNFLKPAILPWFVLIAGGIGIGLRFWLLRTGIDKNNLFISGHPAGILLWVLTAIVAVIVIWGCLPLVQANKYSFNFPPAYTGSVGDCIFSLGILLASIQMLRNNADTLSFATAIVGFLSVPALVLSAVFRQKGIKPLFLLHALVCVFWLLRLIALYRIWSPEPQLQNYIFQLFANVFLMLSCYQRTAFDTDCGVRRFHAITHLAAIFFGCLSLVGSQDYCLYGAGSIWAFADLCRLIPMPGWKPHFPRKEKDHDPA